MRAHRAIHDVGTRPYAPVCEYALGRVITRPNTRDAWSLPYEDTADIHTRLAPAELRVGVMLDMSYEQTFPTDCVWSVLQQPNCA
ncbi:hypothetical protein CH253_04910 [Rhodococcus sp. 06-156-3C]|uniref:hypothetical protein n=1 Tax=Nocardiaceae TaxID=85025 RepID=UPI0005230B37|nr:MULTISPECIES: hypothetical protein [Rhodococcus]OZD11043.1 hypothetical protein CH280_20070 [Rhodococcus sp. 06-156-4C]OZD14458.1 hypothetical protein CH248_24140 [Rhodococcus sp. 06-156-4a]OZD24792.1 hypothetical protein CH253_04910 [Rhodococcus sp. 06-156-3C]OZD27766.1 hypothetical protein CH247_21050 [Rhodococcus sp. 06-156-3b]OZD39747.1 hypothetical protein CH284_04630 [Rhodococcus sp. 06-156-3]